MTTKEYFLLGHVIHHDSVMACGDYTHCQPSDYVTDMNIVGLYTDKEALFATVERMMASRPNTDEVTSYFYVHRLNHINQPDEESGGWYVFTSLEDLRSHLGSVE